MSKKTEVVVCYTEGKFWQEKVDERGEYQEPINVAELDQLAKAEQDLLNILVKELNKRTFKPLSVRAKSIYPLLEHVEHYVKQGAKVKVENLLLSVEFYKN